MARARPRARDEMRLGANHQVVHPRLGRALEIAAVVLFDREFLLELREIVRDRTRYDLGYIWATSRPHLTRTSCCSSCS